jgi:hypothetical protein
MKLRKYVINQHSPYPGESFRTIAVVEVTPEEQTQLAKRNLDDRECLAANLDLFRFVRENSPLYHVPQLSAFIRQPHRDHPQAAQNIFTVTEFWGMDI